MPFGLTNAPAEFQRLMNKILSSVRHIATVYLDDVLMPTADVETGINNLKLVWELLRTAGLTLNLEKCAFLVTSITYLGFEINSKGIKPGAAKIRAVAEFIPPKNVYEVRRFLGLTGYFRHFVKNYASIARPLTSKIKKDQSWLWGEQEQKAFETLKEALMTRYILALYNHQAPTEVHTDASKLGIAGIILQEQENKRLQPVAYFSR